MNAHLADGHRRFLEGLADGWVSEAGASHVFSTATVLHVGTGGGNHFGTTARDNLDAEKFIGLRTSDDLIKTGSGIGRDGASVAGELEFTNLNVDAFGLGFGFSYANDRHFGVGVNDARDNTVVNVTGFAGDDFGAGHAFIFGFVGEHGADHHVADGIDAREVSAEVVVGDDALTLVEFESGFLGAEADRVGLTSHGDEDLIGR